MPLRHKPNRNLISRWSLSQRGNSVKHLKPMLTRPFSNSCIILWPHGEVGSRRAEKTGFFFLFALVKFPKSAFSQATSVASVEPTQNIHSPFFSLFFPSCLSFGSLYMDPTLSARPRGTSEQNTMGTVEQYHAYFPQEGRV